MYQPVPPSTDPEPSCINQYRLLLTQCHHISTSTASYWPSTTKYQPIPTYTVFAWGLQTPAQFTPGLVSISTLLGHLVVTPPIVELIMFFCFCCLSQAGKLSIHSVDCAPLNINEWVHQNAVQIEQLPYTFKQASVSSTNLIQLVGLLSSN